MGPFRFLQDPRNRPTAAELLQHPWMTGEIASTAQIKNGLSQLKRFNARRKFRIGMSYAKQSALYAGVLVVMAPPASTSVCRLRKSIDKSSQTECRRACIRRLHPPVPDCWTASL